MLDDYSGNVVSKFHVELINIFIYLHRIISLKNQTKISIFRHRPNIIVCDIIIYISLY